MDNINVNVNKAEEKAKRNFFKKRNDRFNKASHDYEYQRTGIISGLAKYKMNLKELGFALQKKEKYEYKCRDFNEEFSTIGKPIHPVWILLFIATIYTGEFLVMDDLYNYMTAFMSDTPLLKKILLYLFPLLIILGLYFMVAIASQKNDDADNDDDDFDPLGSNQINPQPIKKSVSKSKYLLNFAKYTPVFVIALLFVFTLINSNEGSGAKVSALALSIVLIALHFVAIKLIDRIVLSIEYFFYEKKITKHNKHIIEKSNIVDNDERSLNEHLLKFERVVEMLKELNPNIQLKMNFSNDDYELLHSLATKSIDFGTAPP